MTSTPTPLNLAHPPDEDPDAWRQMHLTAIGELDRVEQLLVCGFLATAATLMRERGRRPVDGCLTAASCPDGGQGGPLCVLCSVDQAVTRHLGVPSPSAPDPQARERAYRAKGLLAKQLAVDTLDRRPPAPSVDRGEHEVAILSYLAIAVRSGRLTADPRVGEILADTLNRPAARKDTPA